MKSGDKVFKMLLGATFTSIILLLAFTPLGYLRVGVVSISFLPIPVALGAILLGPIWGAYFGLLFGLTSFAQCFMGDVMGAALVAFNFWYTAVMCVVPRIFVGLIPALVFRVVGQHDSKKIISVIAASVSAPLSNTVLFLTTMMLLFYRTSALDGLKESLATDSVIGLMATMAGFNGVIELVVCTIVAAAVAKTLTVYLTKHKLL